MGSLKQFVDYESAIKGKWFDKEPHHGQLADLVTWGIVKGYPDGTFRPGRYAGFIEERIMQWRQIMAEPEKAARYRMLERTCLINGGSGFWMDNWTAVTNAHVVFTRELEERNVFILGNPGLGFPPAIVGGLTGEIIGVDHLNDVAIVKAQRPDYEVDMRHYTVEDMQDQVLKGDKVITAGQPFGQEWDTADGSIRATARYVQVWQLPQQVYGTTLASNPGNSGGPVGLLNGKLIGLVNAGIIGVNLYTYIVPIYHAWRLLKGLPPVQLNGDIP